MLPLTSLRWAQLEHAYGVAADIPDLLAGALNDRRTGDRDDTVWHQLWSALCHQGDTYSAGYAVAPHLVAIASLPSFQRRYDPVQLLGCIELARLEGRGPEIPKDLVDDYRKAVAEARVLAERGVDIAWDDDSRKAFAGSLAALRGDVAGARAIIDDESDDS